eukprot:TRINITY_DN1204_c0_g1_i2.p1 TRINITY_DN1204_c0_g1~~TRINITY_DN1204_c0_g1_i2.p1  ORF type:complete len:565 (+),score=154.65 TRINITY_DN1204_c0_g1_i2:76-1770(+)
MVFSKSVSFILSLASVSTLASGNAFLKKTDSAVAKQYMNQTLVEQRFLQEVRGLVGKGPVDAQLPSIKKALEPMWLALPKNGEGRLGTAQVRYALHRYFVQRHGWHIDGLNRDSSDASTAGIMRERIPAFLMELFEEAFGKSGLMLHELALFAATLEHMIHDEATERLMDVYKALELSTKAPVSDSEVRQVLNAYFMSLVFGQDKLENKASVETHLKRLARTYPSWDDTQMWLADVKNAVSYEQSSKTNPFVAKSKFSFAEVERIAQQVSERLGSFQDTDCRQLKDELLEKEERDNGRLLLSDFYKAGMSGGMQFVERPEFLRHLGALDESKAGEPRVVVANYVLSPGNCLADMGFYSVCCINECESLMAEIERQVAAPYARPAQLASIVAGLSTSTVEASGSLETKAVRRLEQIASINEGRVPLHGRLLAQWLHSLFPRECPLPHANSENPISASEWMQMSNPEKRYKRHEMQKYVETAQAKAQEAEGMASLHDDSSIVHWSDEEDILYLPTEAPKAGSGSFFVKLALVVMAVAGVAVAGVDKARRNSCLPSAVIGKEKAHLV